MRRDAYKRISARLDELGERALTGELTQAEQTAVVSCAFELLLLAERADVTLERFEKHCAAPLRDCTGEAALALGGLVLRPPEERTEEP